MPVALVFHGYFTLDDKSYTALIKGPGRALFRVAARCTAVVLLLMVEGR